MAPQFFTRRLQYIMLSVLLATSLLTVSVRAQGNKPDPDHKTYAVIGAFTVENNATRLVELVKQYSLTATVRNNEHRGLYYVYVFESKDHDAIVAKVLDLREKYSQFYDAWAYTGDFTDKPEDDQHFAQQVEDEENTELATDKPVSESNLVSVASAPLQTQPENVESASATTAAEEKDDDVERATEEAKGEPTFEKKENHFYLYFNAINSKNLKEVKGNVNIIDPERAKQLKEAKSHELVELADPENGTRRVKVATEMFGFREVQFTLDLDDPESLRENPAVELIGDSIVVNFDLQRFKKGDILVMYNVYFFKDAAIMKPESIYELNSLLDMLKENENLVVQIHGHTNGNSSGKIIHLDMEDKNFFSINGEHKESFGSAKKLSLYRSYTIQHWLIEQGIAKENMEIKGWGGKKMIYDKHSTQADKNVRVEIEILEE